MKNICLLIFASILLFASCQKDNLLNDDSTVLDSRSKIETIGSNSNSIETTFDIPTLNLASSDRDLPECCDIDYTVTSTYDEEFDCCIFEISIKNKRRCGIRLVGPGGTILVSSTKDGITKYRFNNCEIPNTKSMPIVIKIYANGNGMTYLCDEIVIPSECKGCCHPDNYNISYYAEYKDSHPFVCCRYYFTFSSVDPDCRYYLLSESGQVLASSLTGNYNEKYCEDTVLYLSTTNSIEDACVTIPIFSAVDGSCN